jgi:hypothetical protein
MFQIPEKAVPISGLAPVVGAAGAVTGDYISLKNAQMAWVVIHYNQGDATAITWHVNRATAVAPTGAAALGNVVPIWSNLDCATSNTLVRRTDAVNYASGTGATNKIIVFQIDPASLGSTYDVIAGASTTAIAATSYVSIMYYVLPKYASTVADQLSFITD